MNLFAERRLVVMGTPEPESKASQIVGRALAVTLQAQPQISTPGQKTAPTVPETTISVFTRHKPTCGHIRDSRIQKVRLPEVHFCLYPGQSPTTRSAPTRCWDRAEELARKIKDEHDPVRIELAWIAREEATRKAAEKARRVGSKGLKRWRPSIKIKSQETRNS